MLVGLGRLGLGLAYPFLQDAGFRVISLYRANSHSHHYQALQKGMYKLCFPNGAEKTIRIPQLRSFSEVKKAVDELEQPPRVFATAVGVTASVPLAVKFLKELYLKFSDAYRKEPLLFLPFENDPALAEEVREQLIRQGAATHFPEFLFASVVVDRICPTIEMRQDWCVVPVEDYQELYFTTPTQEGIPEELNQAWVEPKLFSYLKTRKYWAVNGLQLALGLLALRQGFRPDATLHTLFEKDTTLSALVDKIADEIRAALRWYVAENELAISEDEVQAYVARAATRVLNAENDQIGRYLSPLDELPHMLASLLRGQQPELSVAGFKKWQARIREPSFYLLRHARDCAHEGDLLLPQINLFFCTYVLEKTYCLTHFAI